MATLLTFSAGKAAAQTTANGPYYAWPSWDQQLPASTRFIVLANWKDTKFPSGGAAVLDRETGLVWARSPSTSPLHWASAQQVCNSFEIGGRLGWHLPTLQELASMVDRTQSNPSLPSGHPFQNVQSSGSSAYWSATTLLGDNDFAWAVFFGSGNVGGGHKTLTNLFIWCVRGGQGVDPQ
jgi:hypothetical protein